MVMLKNCACSVFRQDWELTEPRKWKWKLMEPPQRTVVVHYNSHSEGCTWYNHCIQVMKKLYNNYLAQGLPDLPYNFVVGADGEAYCGRGWKRQSDPCLPYPELMGQKIDILLLGDWSNTEPPECMRNMLATLINFGVKRGRIAENYNLLTVDNNLWDNYNKEYSLIIGMEFDVLPRFVTRATWGAEPPVSVHHHAGPLEHVCFNYNTGTESCTGDDQCFPLLRRMQKTYMDEGLSDIPYSFLVGGDGTIYEGRGWHVRTSSVIHGPTMSPRLDIGFLGEFQRETVPKKMYFKGIDWVYYGVRMKLLLRMYSFQENRQPPRYKRGARSFRSYVADAA